VTTILTDGWWGVYFRRRHGGGAFQASLKFVESDMIGDFRDVHYGYLLNRTGIPYGSHNETAIRWENEIETPNGIVGLTPPPRYLCPSCKKKCDDAFKHGILSLKQARVVIDTNEERGGFYLL
jgi:hypothetical protein